MESSRRLLEQAVEAMPIAMVAVSGEGLVTLWNPASEQLFGLDGREALGTDWTGIAEITDVATLVNGQMIASSVEQARAAVMTSGAWAGRLDLRRHTDGRPVIAYCSVSTLDDPAGEKAGALAILQDATAEDLLRRQRDIQRRLAQTVLDISPTMTLVLDRDQRIVMANASWFRGATELGDVPLVGDDFRQLALGSALIAHAREVVPLSAEVSRIIDGPAGSGEVDVEIADARGMVRTFSVHMVRIQPGNGHDNPAVLLVLTDVSVRRAQERQLARQANHDPLTGLPNRGVAEEELTRALARSARTGRNVAVLYCDLDGFKEINDSKGHRVGDLVLQEASRRLHHACRVNDVVARLGGDEFAIIADDVGGPDDVLPLAERILSGIRHPIRVDGFSVGVGISIGIAISPIDDGQAPTAEALLSQADLAMYAAKAAGGNRLEVFSSRLQAEAVSRSSAPASLLKAVHEGNLLVVYQPLVDIRPESPRVHSVESLVRWTSPAHGLLTPDAIRHMGVPESTLHVVDEWVLDHAVAAASSWPDTQVPAVTINVSGGHLASAEWPDKVWAALSTHGLPPSRLCIEFTESGLDMDGSAMVRSLRALRSGGVYLVLDDFGGRRSSPYALDGLLFDAIKVDNRLVNRADASDEGRRLAEATVAFCHALDVPVFAKGVSTAQLRTLCEDIGFDGYQGFGVCRPLLEPDLLDWTDLAAADPRMLASI